MNRNRERRAIEDFQRLDPQFPPGAIEPGEAPDFTVRSDDRCVGIEVCEYFRPERPLGSHPMEQEAFAHRITDRAGGRAIERGVAPCWAVVSVERDVRLLKRDVDGIADAIVEAIYATHGSFIRKDGQLQPSIDDIALHPRDPKPSHSSDQGKQRGYP